jgi:uncharacterized repeat protein (TIGR01451 family)
MRHSLFSVASGFLLKNALVVAACIVPVGVAAQDFSVSLQASKSIVEPRQTFVYTVQVHNTSGAAVEEGEVVLALDDALEVLSVSGGGRRGGDGAQWRDLSIPAGASRSFTVSARVEEDAEDGRTLYATAVAGGGFAETTVEVENEDDENNDDDRRLTLEVFADTPQVEPGEPFILKVAITNKGSRKVTGVNVTLETDERIEVFSAANRGSVSDTEVEWSDIELKAYETRTLSASARVDRSAQRGDVLTSTAYSEAAIFEHRLPVWAPNAGREPMHMFVSADVRAAEPGSTVTYALKVRNMGTRDEQVDVQAYIDPRTRFISASEGGEQFDETLVLFDRLVIEEDDTETLTVEVEVDPTLQPGTVLRFSAQSGIGRQELVLPVIAPSPESESDFFDSQAASSSSSSRRSLFSRREYAPQEDDANVTRIELTAEQSADKDEVQPGSLITYAVQVRNDGNEPAENLVVEDRFSREDITIRDAMKGKTSGESIAWTIPSLAPGEEWQGEYRARVSDNLTHGTVIERQVVVRSNSTLIAEATAGTNVIETLPQAGIGTFVFALDQARSRLHVPLAQAVQPSATQQTKPTATPVPPLRVPPALWITLMLAAAGVGSALALRMQRNAAA